MRQKDLTVVMDGVHASFMKQETLLHCDSVVVGEGEILWQQLLTDFENGGKEGLLGEYSGSRPSMDEVPYPYFKRTNADGRYLISNLFNITRGCLHDCSFCSVTRLPGRKLRQRAASDVVSHIKNRLDDKGRSIQNRFFIFVDDNGLADRLYAKELFKALIPLNILWISQASVNSAYDAGLLRLAAKSGCKGIFVEARLIFGFDTDTTEVFEKTVKMGEALQLDGVQYTIHILMLGTDQYEKMSREERIVHHNWSEYDCTRAQLYEKVREEAGNAAGKRKGQAQHTAQSMRSLCGSLPSCLPVAGYKTLMQCKKSAS